MTGAIMLGAKRLPEDPETSKFGDDEFKAIALHKEYVL